MNNVIEEIENKKKEFEKYNNLYISFIEKESQIKEWSEVFNKLNKKFNKLCEYEKDENIITMLIDKELILTVLFNRDVFNVIREKQNINVFDFLFEELKKISSIEEWEITDLDLTYYFTVTINNNKSPIIIKIPLCSDEITYVLNYYFKLNSNKEK